MLKKIIIFASGAAFVCLLCVVVYADTCGVFLQNDKAAMNLVDKYISSVMKNYIPDGSKVSFRGIIKQGCDFWYYNDYNTKNIAQNHASGSNMEVASADYKIEYNSISYSNKTYTIEATVTETVKYRNNKTPVNTVRKHTILIEQNGNEMYIINDTTQPQSDADEFSQSSHIKTETPEVPAA